jgi:4-amino-4-deoxy-L-arabinose transferase-like glycosyltransferase
LIRLAIAALLALTALRLALAGYLPLTPDENYYFLWAQHLQPGYFDHPPMVALWIKAGTALCGHNALGVRLLGPVTAALGSVLLWDAAEQIAPGRGLAAVLLMNATVMIGAGAILMTPDTPVLFFWIAGLASCARLMTSGNPRWWLVIGAVAGLMLLSKYTGALFIAAVFLWLVTDKQRRCRLATPWPWAGAVIGLALFAPNIAWNAAHGWVSYLKQGGREAGFNPARAGQFFVELVVGQTLICTPIIAVLVGAGLWRLRGNATAGGRLLFWLILVPGLVMLEHVLSDRVQSNWVAILYPSACIAAAMLSAATLRRWLKPAVIFGLLQTLVLYVQAVASPVALPARADTVGAQLAGWHEFAQAAMAGHPAFITTDDYATMAVLAVEGPPGVTVAGFLTQYPPRWAYFNYPPAVTPGTEGVMVTRHAETPCPQLLGTVTRHRGAEVFNTYRLCRFIAPDAGLALPRP